MIKKLAPYIWRTRETFPRNGYFWFEGLEYIGNAVFDGHIQARQHGISCQSKIIMSPIRVSSSHENHPILPFLLSSLVQSAAVGPTALTESKPCWSNSPAQNPKLLPGI